MGYEKHKRAMLAPELVLMNIAAGITAHAGGGQSAATPLVAGVNRVTVVATANDSVLLPGIPMQNSQLVGGVMVFVKNAGLNSLNVFPYLATDQINALGEGNAFAVSAGKSALFACAELGQWDVILSA